MPFVHEIILPEDTYFVMGDNRGLGGSEDSRYFGPVPALSVAGRATAVIWPRRRNGRVELARLTPPEAFEEVPAPDAAAASTDAPTAGGVQTPALAAGTN